MYILYLFVWANVSDNLFQGFKIPNKIGKGYLRLIESICIYIVSMLICNVVQFCLSKLVSFKFQLSGITLEVFCFRHTVPMKIVVYI